jgi:hypothetical protein
MSEGNLRAGPWFALRCRQSAEAPIMPKFPDEERPTEDDIARAKLGPRGVPGAPDPAKMTPQREKKTPQVGEFDGHTA